MKEKIWILCCFCSITFLGKANNVLPMNPDRVLPLLFSEHTDSVAVLATQDLPAAKSEKTVAAPKSVFHFPEIDNKIEAQFQQHNAGWLLDENAALNGDDFLEDIMLKADEYNLHEKVVKAKSLVDNAISIGRLIQKIEAGELVDFPVVLSDTISNVIYTTAIESIKLRSSYAELEVYMGIKIPERDLTLYFGSPSVKFTSSGGIIGDAVLGLYSEVPIPIGGQKAAVVLKAYHRNPAIDPDTNPDDPNLHLGTFVKIDCDGFKGMGLEAAVHFSRDWIMPVHPASGEPVTNSRVVGHFETYAEDWNDILANITMPNFVLTKFQDIRFNLQTAVFDFSDFRNDNAVQFPAEYVEQNLLPENTNLWRGVYIETIEITLPKPFRKKNCIADTDNPDSGSIDLPQQNNASDWVLHDPFLENKAGPDAPVFLPDKAPVIPLKVATEDCRFSFGAHHLLIDGAGVSGEFFATNIISINEGTMDKWRFSVDSINVDVVLNEVTGFGFSGGVGVPIAKATQNFFYSAFIDHSRNYSFALGIADDLEFPLWKAGEVVIESASKIEVDVIDNSFYPRAILNGSISIGLKYDEADNRNLVDAPAIAFRKLALQTTAPYLGIQESGYFRVNEDIGLANFPVSINDIELVTFPGDEVGLNFEINIHMMNAQDHGFSASGDFTIKGKLHTEAGLHSWKYNNFQFNGADITIDLPTVTGHGSIDLFRGDEDFGNGFQASIDLEIMDGKLGVTSNAIFGKTTSGGQNNAGYRYWYVDGMVTFSPGISIVGPLAINGFGGGLYHHMKMTAYEPGASGPGATTSGMVYKPDYNTNFGLKASVSFITTNPMDTESTKANGTLKGTATLQLEFGGGGLQNISLLATAQFLQGGDGPGDSNLQILNKLNARKEKLALSTAQTKTSDRNEVKGPTVDIRASLHLVFDFGNGFDMNGMLAVYAKVANGKVYGVGPQKLAGAAHFLVKRNPQFTWHLYIGGYMDNSLFVEGFNGERVRLAPVGVMFRDGPLTASINAYFMVGNDIPGPGNVPNDVLERFKVDRDRLYNNAAVSGRLARGTGFAFGARFDFKYEYDNDKKRCKRTYADIEGGIGFNIALLKYRTGAYCHPSGRTPVGMKGWRASGNVWGDVRAEGKKFCFSFNRGVGILLVGDAPNPSRFYCKLDILGFRPDFNIGESCTVLQGSGDF